MIDLLLQFLFELARALLVDELSARVRKYVRGWFPGGRTVDSEHRRWSVHQRNRERLLNRLLTETEDEL